MRRSTGISTLLLDLLCAASALLACGLPSQSGAEVVARTALYLLVWVLVAERLGTYLVPLRHSPVAVVRAALETWGVTAAIAGLVDVTVLDTPGATVWRVVVTGALLLVIQRLLVLRTPLRHAGLSRPRVLLVGSGDGTARLTDRDGPAEVDVRGFVPFPGEAEAVGTGLPHLGAIDRLEQVLLEHRIDLALVCPSDRAVMRDVHRALEQCDESGLSVQFFPPFLQLQNLRASLTARDGLQGLALESLPNRSLAQLCKRAIDIVGATAGIALLLPAFAACALAVKLTSRGPVLFPQIRVGRNGAYFRCLKFRTMRVGAQQQQEQLRHGSIQDGPAFKLQNDPRLTRVGPFLRRYSLDELPQLFNVLLGDMSLVGPRPPIPSEVERYSWWQRRRISVKPGLTCVWQVWGRNRVSFKRWVEMDLYYIDNWSLWFDLKLIAHTVQAVVRGTGM
jgi:exopolysaccharide biosynthesis polyprenyl glycosylphosphotransferase